MNKNNKSKYQTIWVKDVPDSVLKIFWEELQKGNVAQLTFYDCMLKNEKEFCEWARQKNKTLRFIVLNNLGLKELNNLTSENISSYFRAMYWLNNPLGKSYMIHFAFLKEAFCEQEEVGQYVVHGLLEAQDESKNFIVDALIGVTPCVYRHALSYIKKLGFCRLGILPNACFFECKNEHKNAVLSLLTRDNLN